MSLPEDVCRPRARRRAVGGLAVVAALVVPLVVAAPVAGAAGTTLPAVVGGAATSVESSTLTLSATAPAVGDTLTVGYSTDQPHALNWVGIYREGQVPGGVPSTLWQYTPGTSGSVDFAIGLAPGAYEVWFLARDGYGALAGPVALTVVADPGAPEPGDPTTPVEIDPVETDVTTDGVIWREGFSTGGAGWLVDGAEPDDGADADGYRGWTFTTRPGWTSTADAMRGRFGRAQETVAVADARQHGADTFASTLTSGPVPVAGLGAARLTFDSHYRGAAGQAGVVRASFDGAEPVEVLRLDEESVTSGYDGMQMNAAQDVVVDVPAGAQEAVFSWELTGGADAWYWAIDSVAVHHVLAETSGTPTQAWVVSDIQGHPHDLAHGIEDLHEIAPDADGLLMVGDIVNSGTVREWDEIYDVMGASEELRPRQTVAAIGNHERYAAGGFEANRDRFLAFAERDRVWDEYVLEGAGGDLPVIVLGQEFAGPSDVAMSEQQVRFLEARLAHWTAQDTQVVVITHFPLGDTVSASWIPWYHAHHQHNDRLTSILGNYPNAIILTGHTHYPAELGDWAVQRRTADGHPDGFWAVNTLAMHVEWDARGENTAGIREVTTRDINRGLTLDSYGDRVVVTAYDFASDEQLRQVTIPNPLVPFDAVPAPEPEPTHPAWDAAAVYAGGEVVSHGGALFRAQWWTSGDVPGASVWGSWTELGVPTACAVGTVDTWTASMVYTGGEQVVHDGAVHAARWWTRNQAPGDPHGPWEQVATC